MEPTGQSKMSKEKENDTRMTSTRFTFQQLKDKESANVNRLKAHYMETRQLFIETDPRQVPFVVIQFSPYCSLNGMIYLPAEIAMTSFNIKNGILENYCTLIDVYDIPQGYGIDAREQCQKLNVPFPPFDTRFQNHKTVTDVIEKFAEKHTPKSSINNTNRKLYCLNKDMKVVKGCLDWLYAQQEKPNPMEVFSLGEVMRLLSCVGIDRRACIEQKTGLEIQFQIIDERKEREKQALESYTMTSDYIHKETGTEGETVASNAKSGAKGPLLKALSIASTSISHRPGGYKKEDWDVVRAGIFYHEDQVEEFLSSFNFAFDAELSCCYHMEGETGLEFCALNITNRYAYNMLDVLTHIHNTEPSATYHYPSIRYAPEEEVTRRRRLLLRWTPNLLLPDETFRRGGNKVPPYFKANYSSVIGPNHPG